MIQLRKSIPAYPVPKAWASATRKDAETLVVMSGNVPDDPAPAQAIRHETVAVAGNRSPATPAEARW